MQLIPALQALSQTIERGDAAVLEFTFANASLNTTVQVADGQIMRLRSSVLPAWHTSLSASGVHPVAIAEAQMNGGGIEGGLKYLLAEGYLTDTELGRIAQERAIAALLPIVWRSGVVTSAGIESVHAQFPALSDARSGLWAAEKHASALSESERALHPSDRLVADPLAPGDAEQGSLSSLIHRTALRGMTLGEMAQRLPVRWDDLTRTVTQMHGQGMLRSGQNVAARQVEAQLRAGQMAPDFCLPEMAGGDLRLSDLRGQPVWLVFNRQSTCALCNPHNAQIIAMHERMRSLGVQVVTVWGSTAEDLRGGVGRLRPPYPVLADPHDETYGRYGLGFSLAGTLDLRNLPTLIQGAKMMGAAAMKSDGEFLRMPAEFLIGSDGRIQVAHYNSYGSEWLGAEQVLNWAAHQA
ncbi:peroxiredoxin-like family protein [Deinococcus sp. UYEF24]